MAEEPIIKVLISKDSLDQLRSENKKLREYYEKHKSNCTKDKNSDSLLQLGSGNSNNEYSPLCNCEEKCVDKCGFNLTTGEPTRGDNSFNPSLSSIIPQESPVTQEFIDQEFPISLVLSKQSEKYRLKAKSLLDTLLNSSSFKIDKNSMVYIDNTPLHVSIYELMDLTFLNKHKSIEKIFPYIELLQKLDLGQFITNKYLKYLKDLDSSGVSEVSPGKASKLWFYLGPCV